MTYQTITRLLLPVLLACVPQLSGAASHGHGRVLMQGSIIDSACAIATGDADQSIDLGTVPISELVVNRRTPEVGFTVHLVNCALSGNDVRGRDRWKDVRIIFDGLADGTHGFALQGEGRGEALYIADVNGTGVVPGKPMPASAIEPGSMALRYWMQLVGNNHPLRPGDLHTTLRYFMEYD